MATLGLILLILFFVLGFFSILLGLPGTWIILFSSAFYGWATDFQKIGSSTLFLLFFLATLAEIGEYYFGLAGARRYGASGKAAMVSILGGVVGAVLFAPILFGIGSLIGLFIGAFLGAFLYEFVAHKDFAQSAKSGFGAFLGRVSGTMAKLFLALAMIVFVLWSLL